MKRERGSIRYTVERDAFRSEGGFLRVNKNLIRLFGPLNALVLANLVEKDCYFNSTNAGWFFCTNESQMEALGITLRVLRASKQLLKDNGILYSKKEGIPSKEYFSIDYNQIKYCIESGIRISDEELQSIEITHPGSLESAKPGSLESLKPGPLNSITKVIPFLNKNKKNKKKTYTSNSGKFDNEEETLIKKIKISQFDKFWELYPHEKHNSKGKSLSLWKDICKRKDAPSWREIFTAIKEQKKTKRWKDGFIPLTTTWLNQSRWLDDPEEMNEDYDRTNSNNGPDAYKEKEVDPKFKTRHLREEDI